MARRKTIALDQDEKNRLEEYRRTNYNYSESVPYGEVITDLLNKAEQ